MVPSSSASMIFSRAAPERCSRRRRNQACDREWGLTDPNGSHVRRGRSSYYGDGESGLWERRRAESGKGARRRRLSWWSNRRNRALFGRSESHRVCARLDIDAWRAASERIVAVFAKWTPPERGKGIASEDVVSDDFLNEKSNVEGKSKREWVDSNDGGKRFEERGIDVGENGYRCRWLLTGGASKDGRISWRETYWEKYNDLEYKELGFEKSGKDEKGDDWYESWRAIYYQDDYGISNIRKRADKGAKNPQEGSEWSEKWWENTTFRGHFEKGVEKIGFQEKRSWGERWGEAHTAPGRTRRWSDKWAQGEDGDKWGDKWEELFETDMTGAKMGETWYLKKNGERWNRHWGEDYLAEGKVRKHGYSNAGENWDAVVFEDTTARKARRPTFKGGAQAWLDVMNSSMKLLSVGTKRPSS